MSSLCYAYAVQARGGSMPPDVRGFHNRPLFTVAHRDLQAVVSDLDGNRLQATGQSVLHHEAVVEAVRQVGPAIPIRFGTVLYDPDAVASALAKRYPTLVNDLERLGDKVELGVSILWHQPRVDEVSAEEDHGASTPRGRGTRYLRARFSKYRQDAAHRDRATQLAAMVDGELASHALEHRRAVLPTESLLMRSAYLIHPSDVEVFQAGFAELHGKYPDLRFLLSGPWPPYSFVSATEVGGRSVLDRLLLNADRELGIAVQRDEEPPQRSAPVSKGEHDDHRGQEIKARS